MITLTLPVVPIAKERARFTRDGRAYTPPKTRRYEREVQWHARALYRGAPLTGELRLTARFYFARPKSSKRTAHTVKPDLSNLLKALEDSLNGITWADDCQVTQYGTSTGKYYDLTNQAQPRIELVVEPISPEAK
jgi:Holliday junction resolvase RusA-like endonuclease